MTWFPENIPWIALPAYRMWFQLLPRTNNVQKRWSFSQKPMLAIKSMILKLRQKDAKALAEVKFKTELRDFFSWIKTKTRRKFSRGPFGSRDFSLCHEMALTRHPTKWDNKPDRVFWIGVAASSLFLRFNPRIDFIFQYGERHGAVFQHRVVE